MKLSCLNTALSHSICSLAWMCACLIDQCSCRVARAISLEPTMFTPLKRGCYQPRSRCNPPIHMRWDTVSRRHNKEPLWKSRAHGRALPQVVQWKGARLCRRMSGRRCVRSPCRSLSSFHPLSPPEADHLSVAPFSFQLRPPPGGRQCVCCIKGRPAESTHVPQC